MPADLDLIIIGAGCAGLSLGIQLAKMNSTTPKTLLLESRKEYQNDRTWCFWGQSGAAYTELASHQWTKLTVQSGKEKVLFDCTFAPYQILPSQIFYNFAIHTIAKNAALDLKMDSVVLQEPLYQEGWWHLETSFGRIRSRAVVDTRPKPIESLKSTKLWQSFLGYEIESTEAIFDPSTAQLMDFCQSNPIFVGFNYVLPQSEQRALIEFTIFSDRPYLPNELQSQLDQSVLQYLKGSNFKIVRTESGIIPMGLPTDKAQLSYAMDPSYVYVGLTAGGARAATGYAFQRIQEWAIDCASAIQNTGLPVAHKNDPYLLNKMDNIFLNVIRNNPNLGPDLFMDLFTKVESKSLVRFLSDKANALDYLAVIKALPAAPFLRDIFNFSKV
jgi:lycopene beta-cyclase